MIDELLVLELFDTHCHFDFEDFDADRHSLWSACRTQSIFNMVIPGVAPEQWPRMQALCESASGLYYAVGLHPCWLHIDNANLFSYPPSPTPKVAVGFTPSSAEERKKSLTLLRDQLISAANRSNNRCVAIGECGLDQFINGDIAWQEAVLHCHLQVAVELNLPIILHCRRAHNELLRCLKRYRLPKGGILHAYSGSTEQARQYCERGLFLGIGGTITYPRANKTRVAVAELPLDKMVLETDAPDMPLQGHQGQRNTSLQLVNIARTLAELRSEPIEHIAAITTQNAKQLFGLSMP